MQKPTELLETYEQKTHKRNYSSANKKTPGIMNTNTENQTSHGHHNHSKFKTKWKTDKIQRIKDPDIKIIKENQKYSLHPNHPLFGTYQPFH